MAQTRNHLFSTIDFFHVFVARRSVVIVVVVIVVVVIVVVVVVVVVVVSFDFLPSLNFEQEGPNLQQDFQN